MREFFRRESGRLARACHQMAVAFARGGTLIPFGSGPAATDAAHAAVEFMHPVIVGKRAFPAIAPGNDPTGLSTLTRLARPGDIALALAHRTGDPAFAGFLDEARSLGLLTIAFTAEPAGDLAMNGEHRSGTPEADHLFAVPGDDPAVVQEVQETAYHVLWELVHVFFEQPGLIEGEAAGACITCGDVAITAEVIEAGGATAVIEKDGAREQIATELVDDVQVGDRLLCHAGVALEKVDAEPTGFLYPFLGGGPDRGEPDLENVLAELESSTVRKAEEVIALRARIDLEAIARCGAEIRGRLDAGGRLIAFGNGGSATDAQDLAADALAHGWPAIALGNDPATVTAVANDVGFDQAFARQLAALARPGDVAVAISTSGGSANLITAMDLATGIGALTVAIAGHDGGRLAEVEGLDHLFVVPSEYIPRIQEAQATICHLLVDEACR
ncbi:MAG: SIS domain-containing protein [Acidobacteriota bacterium]